jgi:hypothetical protein
MKQVSLRICAAIFALLALRSFAMAQRAPAPSEELNTMLMHATFEIFGPEKDQPGKFSFGTIFIMGVRPNNGPPLNLASIVLVTAAHVLDDIGTDQATLMVRRKESDGTYASYPFQLPIRKNGQPLYVKHPSADVAAMYADLPDDVPMTGVPPEFLASDERILDIELHPGDDVFVLGFPLATSGPGGFPILRSAHLASFPLVPTKVVKKFYFDLFLYGGNSGGPVYFSYVNRFFKGQTHFTVEQGILGLVIQEAHSPLPEFTDKSMNFGVVVPASFIRETIESLPLKS